jgi:hypothetical protein
MSCPGDLYVVPGAAPCAGGGGGGGGVTTLQSLTGEINFQSTGDTITVTTVGNNINLEGAATGVTEIIAGTGCTIDPSPGVGAVTVNVNAGVDSINNCLGNITLEAGDSSITVTSTPGSGVGTISLVANFPVATLTGVGAAVVTEPTPGQFEVSVAPGNTNSLNSYIQSIGQLTGFDLPQGGAPQYIAIDLPGSFPTASLGLYSFVDIEVNVILTGTGAVNFGGGSCQFGFIWTTGVPSGVPATLEFAGTVAGSAFNPYSFSLGFIRVPTAQFAQPPGTTDLNLYIANTSLTSSPAVNFSIEWFASKHRATLTN